MITYKKCSQVDVNLIYNGFNVGFSDYMIKIQVPKDVFMTRFFETEGNSLEQSFIALHENRAIGIVFGGMKNYEGINTMRCGSLAVDNAYRGKGVSQELMKLHKEEAIKQGCKQLFLEVIMGNNRAIKFYNKLGYNKIYDLSYFSLNKVNTLQENSKLKLEVKFSSIEELRLIREKLKDVHINWQNDVEYIEKLQGQLTLGAYINDKIAGIISMNKNTKISFIWVENRLRHNGIGTTLLVNAVKKLNLFKASISFPNSSVIQGFINHIGFEREPVSQYEMYLSL
jgi:ribosomal protein S18 acetylase RimI-like enzyme